MLTITAVISFAIRAPAQTNSWTKPTSGDWHEPFWSLGLLPSANQSHIMFRNEGWKALAITRVTARDFPNSLNIPRLTVASPTNTMNTLMLNFAGLESPLRVASDFDLGSNSVLLTLSSALEVGNDFLVNGAVNHGDNSLVSASYLYVGNSSPGIYNLSNGLLRAGYLTLGFGTTSSLHQLGGRLSVTNQLTLGQGNRRTFIEGSGHFELTAGILTAPRIQIGEQNSRLGPPGADGTFVQSGGSNFAGGLLLGWPESDASSGENFTYTLNAGLLMTSNTFVFGGNGHFAQGGGLHGVDGPLAVAGFYGRSFSLFHAQYTLSGGVVTARSLDVDFGAMAQSAGTNQISGDLVIGRKGAMSRRSFYELTGGALSTSNTFVINSEYGGFTQSGGTHTVRDLLEIAGFPRSFGPGYTLSAGELFANNIRVSTKATLSQTGGFAAAAQMSVAEGEYALSGGNVLIGGLFIGHAATGVVHQTAGTLVATNRVLLGTGDSRTSRAGRGEFELSGGSLRTPELQLGTISGFPGYPGGEALFVQLGGSNSARNLVVGTWDSIDRNENTYMLNAGTLATSNTLVHPDSRILQSGGVHWVSGPLTVRGNISRLTPRPAVYSLTNGLVHSGSLQIELANFAQLGGTNAVEGDLRIVQPGLGHTEYVLAEGVLRSLNTIVAPANRASFIQDGGTNIIGGTLDLPAPTFPLSPTVNSVTYRLQGGVLDVRDIRIGSNSTFAHVSGTIAHRGTLTLVGGRWQSAMGEHQLGALKLEAAGTNSALLLDDSATVLRFANSSGTSWDLAASLLIHNWRGSTNGGGSHRIHFGNSSSGLTSQQLGQIVFRDPLGLPAGNYSANILSTGEIIPLQPTGRGPAISYQRSAGQLRMEWPEGYTLQTSTNIAGPFQDVNTNSPVNFDTTDPQRFFRFRQQ